MPIAQSEPQYIGKQNPQIRHPMKKECSFASSLQRTRKILPVRSSRQSADARSLRRGLTNPKLGLADLRRRAAQCERRNSWAARDLGPGQAFHAGLLRLAAAILPRGTPLDKALACSARSRGEGAVHWHGC